ncbi:MASE1 domain-containing protein, partial [Actinoplanes philippinensis]|uniref:MASE1 domain-containing protein n=1 Tax=Actinoplanes philippinensis TaxID=35752 RepID=UPI0033DC6488
MSAAVRSWRLLPVLLVVAAAYGAGASLAFVGFGAASMVVLFLPAGVTLAALVLNPWRRWPWILSVVAVTEVVVDVSHGMPVRWACGFALANTLEPVTGALLLRRVVPGRVDLLRRRHLLAFLLCCVAGGPLAGAVTAATAMSVAMGRSWLPSFVSFWTGDATGVLAVGGCVLAWWQGGSRAAARRLVPAVGLAVIATAAGFWPQERPVFYLPLVVLFGLPPPLITSVLDHRRVERPPCPESPARYAGHPAG